MIMPAHTAGLFEEILRQGCALRVQVTGRSMTPFLRSGEIVIVRPVPAATVQIGDIIFFRDRRGQLLLHRLIKKKRLPGGLHFQTKGDAVRGLDEPIAEDRLLGKACRIETSWPGRGSPSSINLESVTWKWTNALIAGMSLCKLGVVALCQHVKRAL
jgi:signal peptidase I